MFLLDCFLDPSNVNCAFSGSVRENLKQAVASSSLQSNTFCGSTDAALSNYSILRTIFCNFKDTELRLCCNVNKFWRYVADPLISMQYDVHLMKNSSAGQCARFSYIDGDVSGLEDFIVLRKKDKYSLKVTVTEEYKCSYQDAQAIMETTLQREKISLNLYVEYESKDNQWTEEENLKGFLSKFGIYVGSFHPWAPQTKELYMFLLFNLPSLEHLSYRKIQAGRETVIPEETLNLQGKQLFLLKSIDLLFCGSLNFTSLERILKIAPNLEEIHHAQKNLLPHLATLQKGHLVKSLSDSENLYNVSDYDAYEDALGKFADAEPKLISFSLFLPSLKSQARSVSEMHKHALRILKSSHASLESLKMQPSESLNFQAIPPMTALKEIVFVYSGRYDEDYTQFFPDVNLQHVFPNVSTVEIFAHPDINFTLPRFPQNNFSPWGSQIKCLKIRCQKIAASGFFKLHKTFPSVQEFEIRSLPASPCDLKTPLETIAKIWPQLEYLTFVLTPINVKYKWEQSCTLDSVFTGIPDSVLVQLRNPAERKSWMFSKQFQRITDYPPSPLRKLSNLKVLTFDCGFYPDGLEKIATLTPLSVEFAFRFVPELKFVVRTMRRNYRYTTGVKTALKDLVHSELEIY